MDIYYQRDCKTPTVAEWKARCKKPEYEDGQDDYRATRFLGLDNIFAFLVEHIGLEKATKAREAWKKAE